MIKEFIFKKGEFPELPTEEEDRKLLQDRNNPESMEKLIKISLRLVVFVAKKYKNSNIDMEDLYSIGVIGLKKAIDSYKIERSINFNTYAFKCIQNEIRWYIRKQRRWNEIDYLSEIIYQKDNGEYVKREDIIEDKGENARFAEKIAMVELISNTITLVLNELTLKEKEIFLLRMGGKKQQEISKEKGFSQSHVSRIEKRNYKKVQEFSEIGINKNSELEFVFLYTEISYEFRILLKLNPNLKEKLSILISSLDENYRRFCKKVQIKERNGYLFFVLPQQEESFLFMDEVLTRVELYKN